MILNFTVTNWMSFRDQAELSLVASSERQHGERLPAVSSLQRRVLPIATIYGGNASGKTNLFHALHFMQSLVVEGTKVDASIRVEPFRLDQSCLQQPSSFVIEVLIDDKVWDYRFSCDRKRIVTESLRVLTRSSEKILFERQGDQITLGTSTSDQQFLDFAARGTRTNQLYLTNAVSQKIEDFKPLYDWFRTRLVMIAPDARFGAFEQLFDEAGPYANVMSQTLARLDTGIHRLACEPVDPEHLSIPKALWDNMVNELPEHGAIRFVDPATKDRVIIRRKNGVIEAQRMVAFHRRADGEDIRFEMRHESDGTQRTIDLLPAFLDLAQQGDKIYVIDEVDRSLHTHLTRSLITAYLDACTTSTRSQLLMTTHDVQLMDQKLLRRDEMWLVERSSDGNSRLVPFSDFNADSRYDKDIRKAYLQGRMGGVPRLQPWQVTTADDPVSA